MRYDSIGDAIGGTPLVRVDALLPEAARAKGIHLYAKVELLGPTGSIKDRTAKTANYFSLSVRFSLKV